MDRQALGKELRKVASAVAEEREQRKMITKRLTQTTDAWRSVEQQLMVCQVELAATVRALEEEQEAHEATRLDLAQEIELRKDAESRAARLERKEHEKCRQ